MSLLKKIILSCIVLLILTGAFAFYLYKGAALKNGKSAIILLQDKDNTETLNTRLTAEYGMYFPFVFRYLAKEMHLENNMKKGRYTIPEHATLIEIVRIFREGKTKTCNLTIKPLIGLEKFAAKCGERLEPDSADFYAILQDTIFLDSIGFTRETVYALLLPDTYNLLWHTSPDELLFKMLKEYNTFWNEERRKKAERSQLNPIQIVILASIVSKETNKYDEMPMVAGMYINRLKLNMPLQADPTVKFALHNQGIRRVLNTHLTVESPYNTYLNKGLPPGPICIPSKQSIEAVLDYTEHDFIFMCAKDDFSGYHTFSKEYTTHLKNAGKYRKALDARGIQ